MDFTGGTQRKPIPSVLCNLKIQYMADQVASKISDSLGQWTQIMDKDKHYPMKPVKAILSTHKKPNRTLTPNLRLVVCQQGGFEPLPPSKLEALQRQSHAVNQASADEKITTMYPISMEEMGIPRSEKKELQLIKVPLIWQKVTHLMPCYIVQAYSSTSDIVSSSLYAPSESEEIYEAQLPDTVPLVFGPDYNYFLYHEETNTFGLHFQCTNDAGDEITATADRGTSVDRSFMLELFGTYFTKHVAQKSPLINYDQLPEWAKLPKESEAELNKLGFTNKRVIREVPIAGRPMITDGREYGPGTASMQDLNQRFLESLGIHELQQPMGLMPVSQAAVFVRAAPGFSMPPQNPIFTPGLRMPEPRYASTAGQGSSMPQYAANIIEIPDDDHNE